MRSYGVLPLDLMGRLEALSPRARFAAMVLRGHQLSNMAGLYRLPVGYLAEDLGCTPDEAEEALVELEGAGEIQREKSWVWVIDMAAMELRVDKVSPLDNRFKSIREVLAVAPCFLAKQWIERYLEEPLVEGLPEGLGKGPPKPGSGSESGSGSEEDQDMFPAAGNEQEDSRCQSKTARSSSPARTAANPPAKSSGAAPASIAGKPTTLPPHHPEPRSSEAPAPASPPCPSSSAGPTTDGGAEPCESHETNGRSPSPGCSSNASARSTGTTRPSRRPPEIPPELRAAIPEIEELWGERMAGFEKKITPSAEAAQLRKATRWLKKWSPAAVRASIERSTGAWQGLFEPEREVEKPKERTVTAADILAREDAWIRENLPEEHDEQAN